MYNSLKTQISYGTFNVVDMQRRAKKLFALGELTETQLDDLFSLMAENANPDTERPELLNLIQSLFAKVDALSDRVKALESGNTDGDAADGDAGEYPEWKPWDGLSNQYQPGSIVRHNDQLWQSAFSGQNVWEPGTVGDQFWVKYTPEE